MNIRHVFQWVCLPIAGVLLYFSALAVLPQHWMKFIASEVGPVELGTAALFASAGFLAVRMVREQADSLPSMIRGFWIVFAAIAFFVACEELSWGQHLIGWRTPEVVAGMNKQHETNLHNMFSSKPSRLMRNVATLALPVCFCVLPVVASAFRRRKLHPLQDSIQYYLLPRFELITLTLLSAVITVPKKLSVPGFEAKELTSRLGEVKEFLWAIAIFSYVAMIRHRMMAEPAPKTISTPLPTFPSVDARQPARRAA